MPDNDPNEKVVMRHPDLNNGEPIRGYTRKQFEVVWQHRGYELVEADTEAEAETPRETIEADEKAQQADSDEGTAAGGSSSRGGRRSR